MPLAPFHQQITFLHCKDLTQTQHFYTQIVGLDLARDQGTCIIFQVNNSAYLGFCEHIEPIEPGRKVILTLVTDDVDAWYQALKDKGAETLSPPKHHPKFQIYHFFLKDPDGYWIEIQKFNAPL